jgi:site-specific recombinase XerD
MPDHDDLEPLDPATAMQMYLDERRHEVAAATLQSHEYRLNQFVAWCDDHGIDNLNDFTARDIHRYRVKRRDEDGLATATMKGQLATLRLFCRFCASVNAMRPGLDEKIILPTTTADDARDELLERDTAEQVLEHLEQYRYATIDHTLLEVLWHTGLRIGATIGLDIRDYNPEEQSLELVHRPQTGTPLKNGTTSERFVAVNDRVCRVLDDWLEVNHPGVTDEHERQPLLASKFDRLSRNRARSITYEYTRPCVFADTCPHDREIDACESSGNRKAYACPSSLSPHPVRRGSITFHLQEDTPKPVVSDRMDVGEDVLDRHYDQRSAQEKLEQRRQYLPGE